MGKRRRKSGFGDLETLVSELESVLHVRIRLDDMKPYMASGGTDAPCLLEPEIHTKKSKGSAKAGREGWPPAETEARAMSGLLSPTASGALLVYRNARLLAWSPGSGRQLGLKLCKGRVSGEAGQIRRLALQALQDGNVCWTKASGRTYRLVAFTPRCAQELLMVWLTEAQAVRKVSGTLAVPRDNELSAAEERVAGCLVRGRSNKEIARELTCSAHTVRAHLRRIFQKLEVASRTQAMRVLMQREAASSSGSSRTHASVDG